MNCTAGLRRRVYYRHKMSGKGRGTIFVSIVQGLKMRRDERNDFTR
jgi:hypothetical protein